MSASMVDRTALTPSTPMPVKSDEPSPRKQWTRAQIAQAIALGDVLVVHNRLIYRLNAWLSRHPGGELAILHFCGRDATDEIQAYHSDETLRRMKAFCVGEVAEQDWGKLGEKWRPLVPPVQLGYRHGKLDREVYPVRQGPSMDEATMSKEEKRTEWARAGGGGGRDGATPPGPSHPKTFPLPVSLLEPELVPGIDPEEQHAITVRYRELHEEIKAAGLYECPYWSGYGMEMVRYSILGLLAFLTWYNAQGRTAWYLASSVFLGLFWHQVTFVVHDAGHSGITHNYIVDRSIGVFVASFIGGLSIGWWCDNHDVHHLVTNHPEHDPDIQHIPFFAISTRFFSSLWSTYYQRLMSFDKASKVLIKVQHKLYYFIMSLARFNLYNLSYTYLLSRARPSWSRNAEFVGIFVFWCWFGSLLKSLPGWKTRLVYLLVSNAFASPLHVQIVLSHFAQSTEDLGLYESFAHRQLRTTMDVACPPSIEFIHGGLHMQVSHHLFPRLPRHNLRVASAYVKRFAEENGMNYEIYTFTKGNYKVLGVLRNVAEQVDLLTKVAENEVKERLEGKAGHAN